MQVHASDIDSGFDGEVQYRFANLEEQSNAKVAKQFFINENVNFFFLKYKI